ncbi:MAG: hypothetical protein D6680_00025 [Cyanobacteria bacterium J007]|jgi:hypothetical protein|nr:MAG: hypothetical protein D6680_00025 [Cyanobacteria bacterium J007]
MHGRLRGTLREATSRLRRPQSCQSAIIRAEKQHFLAMPQVLTVSCKLDLSPQQVEKLDAVLSATRLEAPR